MRLLGTAGTPLTSPLFAHLRLAMPVSRTALPAAGTEPLPGLADLPSARDLFVYHPSAAYGDPYEGVPGLFLLDGFAGRLAIEQVRQEILARPPSPGQFLAGLSPSATASLQDALAGLSRRVTSLRDAALALLQDGTWRQGEAATSDGGDLSIRATATDGVGALPASLRVLRLASAQEAASDARPDAGAALGIRGRFLIDGVEVAVLATDDLYALARRINYGEDANANGRLDGAEDRNFNYALDPFEDANGNGRLETGEDLDADGVIDAGEDLNANGRLDANEDLDHDFKLDGGAAVHGVEARVSEGRLLLRRVIPGLEPIEVSDPEGILGTLGLVARDPRDQQVFQNLRAEPGGASLVKDGQPVAIDRNVSSDLMIGVDLELRRAAGPVVTVSVLRNPATAVSAVRRFVSEFNEAVRGLNGLLAEGGVAAREPRVQRFRRSLERASQDPLISGTPWLPQAGLEPTSTRDVTFGELQIRAALERLRDGLGSALDGAHGVPAVLGHLHQMGITGSDDDTLALDEALLDSALAGDPAGVRSLLGDPERGIAAGVIAAVEAAADPRTGSLPRFGRALSRLDLSAIAEGLRRSQLAQVAGEESRLLAVA